VFAAHARELIRRELEALFAHLEGRIEQERNGADLWRRDIERFLAIARRTLAGRDLHLPRDLGDTGASGQEHLQQLVVGHGELLEAWPDLFEASRSRGSQEPWRRSAAIA
jgi:hypothetical protein